MLSPPPPPHYYIGQTDGYGWGVGGRAEFSFSENARIISVTVVVDRIMEKMFVQIVDIGT